LIGQKFYQKRLGLGDQVKEVNQPIVGNHQSEKTKIFRGCVRRKGLLDELVEIIVISTMGSFVHQET
jgi:heterodisulfide reductase subunit A-like polyferredoxin